MAENSDTSTESQTPLPVKSLRSRFEQLSAPDASQPTSSDRELRRRSAQSFLTLDHHLAPRPRSATSTELNVNAHHLRSASTSDLLHPNETDTSACSRRPPPPTPPQRRSPLLRPVLIPIERSTENSESESVTSLRNKFSNGGPALPPRVSSPRLDTSNEMSPKPAIPPRSIRASELDSPSSKTPPNLPVRRVAHPKAASSSSSFTSVSSNETPSPASLVAQAPPSPSLSGSRLALHRPIPPPPEPVSATQSDDTISSLRSSVASLRDRFSHTAERFRNGVHLPEHSDKPAIPPRPPIRIFHPISASPDELTPQSAVGPPNPVSQLSELSSFGDQSPLPSLPPRKSTVTPSVVRAPSLHSQGASSSSTTTSESSIDAPTFYASSSNSSLSLPPPLCDPFLTRSGSTVPDPLVSSPAPAIPPRPSPRLPALSLHSSAAQSIMEVTAYQEQLSSAELPPSPSLPPRKSISPSSASYDATTQAPRPPAPKPPPRYRSTPTSSTPPSEVSPVTPSNLPPRPVPPPPRPRTSNGPEAPEPPSSSAPPPLPVRRSNPTPPDEPKTVSRLPPPPTRTIAIGDKLPPARRLHASSSDEDSGDEVEQKDTTADLLPDSSHSSRRPPVLDLAKAAKISVSVYVGHVCVSGKTVVVATGHHVRIYDLSVTTSIPLLSMDSKEFLTKDAKITSMEIRSVDLEADRGCLLWIGTREGHLVEMDSRTGAVIAVRYSVHLHPIVQIFRHGRAMATLDDSGKALVFEPLPGGPQVDLQTCTPRVVRVTEKLDFVKVIGGRLWTAARTDAHGHGTPSRTPIIRVYDLFDMSAGAGGGRSVIPTEHVGPVTSAAVLSSEPGTVYVGHEEGFVSVWAMEGPDGWPKCTDVIRVATSDVLSLEGVNNRLWAGGRNGMIAAYDVTVRPWVVTNSWVAHPGLPVLKLAVDHFGIEQAGHLCVTSVGRDENIRFWDGLLGSDWIEHELAKHEKEYSRFRELRLLVVSWNVDAAKPDSLTGSPANLTFLQDAICAVDSPDVIVFGFQEVIDLESRKMTAKNVLLGKKRPEDGGLSDRVTGAYKRWYDRLVSVVRTTMPPETPYAVVHTESLVGLFTCIFVKNSQRAAMRDMAITTIKRGVGGRYGNKGGILSRFVVDDTSFCLINCHLAAGQHAVRARNADVAAMLEERAVFPVAEKALPYVGGGDGTMVLDHEIVFINGDMNYRIDQRRDPIIAAVRAGELESLWPHDQLLKELKYNRGHRLRGFSEGPLLFPPTYKYDRRSNEFDSSEKRRSPAWCDRVLWRSRVPSRVKQLHYQRYEADVSDHRPISAAFDVKVRSTSQEVRTGVLRDVQRAWNEEQMRLLAAAKEHYVAQSML